ncbi:hypothetical protein SPLC1_S411170 [Arthrospira platensis C1]|nr:hypothetical protein SPLC1_S411170 [Arthrospira platensis C1]
MVILKGLGISEHLQSNGPPQVVAIAPVNGFYTDIRGNCSIQFF